MQATRLTLGVTEEGRHAVLLETTDEDVARLIFELVDAKLNEHGVTIYDSTTDNN